LHSQWKSAAAMFGSRLRAEEEKGDQRALCGNLGERQKRRQRRRAAEKGDDLAPFHLICSPAGAILRAPQIADFHSRCRQNGSVPFKLRPRSAKETEQDIARRIIDLQVGESDPDRLCQLTLAHLGYLDPASAGADALGVLRRWHDPCGQTAIGS